MNLPKLSFIIPALNEEALISNTIKSAKTALASTDFEGEIILVDHGSSDKTIAIAEGCGITVYEHPYGTIASLRNYGALKSSGELLVFIDADVSLTESWAENINETIDQYNEGIKLITGSQCTPPDFSNFLHRYWYGSFTLDTRETHLGTGHLIVSKLGFEDIGGFDENLSTGEDYEFCKRAKMKQYEIYNNVKLRVVHHGFPTDLRSFIYREAWHGEGDLVSLRHMLASKVALVSILFTTLHLLLLTSLFFLSIPAFTGLIIVLLAMLIGSSYLKNAHANLKAIIINSYIFYFYYVGRSLALIRAVSRKMRNS